MDELFGDFVKEIRFIRNFTPKTISTYEQAWNPYRRHCGDINRAQLTQFMIDMRENKISPAGCNSYIRPINSFLETIFLLTRE